MTESVMVFNPTATIQSARRLLPPTLNGLSGKVVGFIDNSKPNFDHLIDDVADLLVSEYGVAAVVKRRKRGPSIPAPDSMMQEIYEQCDAVITGSGE